MRGIVNVLFVLVLVTSLGSAVNQTLVAAATQVGNPTIWYVAEGGSGKKDGSSLSNAFSTIQEAINATKDGDTIMVASGTYAAFQVIGKNNIQIISADGGTVATTNLYQDLPIVGKAWVLAAVYDSRNISIKGLNFDGSRVSGTPVVVGIAYVDSTGKVTHLTVKSVVATSLGAGVAVIGHKSACAVEVADATVSNNNAGIYVCGGSSLEAHFNKIVDNAQCGVLNDGGRPVDATYNWWGHASGPLHETNPLGKGNAVIGDVGFKPWLGDAPAVVKTETVTLCARCTVDAKREADTEVIVRGTATVTISNLKVIGTSATAIARYARSLHLATYDDFVGYAPASFDSMELSDEFKPLGIFRDVRVTDTTPGTEIEIRLYYTDAEARGFNETTLRLHWWNGDAFVPCSPDASSGVNTTDITTGADGYSGYIWARITDTTTPSLADLQGTPWGGYGHPTEVKDICFVATAAYGTDTAQKIDTLREFRDAVLLPCAFGAELVSIYYRTSPPIARLVSQHTILKTMVRVGFVDPVATVLSWIHHLWSAGG